MDASRTGDNRPRGGMILVNAKGEVLIIKDGRTGKWSFPKGAAETCDADLLQTAIRECREEVGLQPERDYTVFAERVMNHHHNKYYISELVQGAEARMTLESKVCGIAWILPERYSECEIPFADFNAGVRFFLTEWK